MNEVIKYPQYPIIKARRDNYTELYLPYKIKGILIPKGYKSDGLSLKARVFRIVVSKHSPKFAPFFFLHDFLTDTDDASKYKKANELSAQVLYEIENSVRTKVMMFFIRIYFFIKYKVW